MYFKKVSDMQEGVTILNNFIKEYSSIDNMKKVIEYNRCYLYRDIYNAELKLTKADPYKYLYVLRALLQPFLVFKALYYPQYNLLALCFYDEQGIIDKYFDGMIEFQNSTDQDYDYNTWNILGDFFINKAKEFETMSVDGLIKTSKYFLEDYNNDKEYFLKRIDYCSRSAMYDFVWNTLDLDCWLYHKESKSNIFIPINLCVPLVNDNETLFFELHKHFFKLWEEDNKKGEH
jgi:hypothetical protein